MKKEKKDGAFLLQIIVRDFLEGWFQCFVGCSYYQMHNILGRTED